MLEIGPNLAETIKVISIVVALILAVYVFMRIMLD